MLRFASVDCNTLETIKEEREIKEERDTSADENSEISLIDIKEEGEDEEEEEEEEDDDDDEETEDLVIKEEHVVATLGTSEITEEEWESTKKIKLHKCPYVNCERTFTRRARLNCHIRFHTGNHSHRCEAPGCNRAYFNASSLRRHIAIAHTSESVCKKMLKCPYPGCGMELSYPQNLKRHIYRKHESVYLFPCEYCEKGFSKYTHLQSHMYLHTGILPLTCSRCHMRFRTPRDLKRHNRSHSTSYACDFPNCGQRFERRVHLMRHVTLQHPTEYICDICNKNFKAKCRLMEHMIVHQETSKRQRLVCPHRGCSRSYYHKRNLTFHIQARHKGKKIKTELQEINNSGTGTNLQQRTTGSEVVGITSREETPSSSSQCPTPSEICAQRTETSPEKTLSAPIKQEENSQESSEISFVFNAMKALQGISPSMAPVDGEDCYDHFGRYVASMLRTIGPPGAESLQEGITAVFNDRTCAPAITDASASQTPPTTACSEEDTMESNNSASITEYSSGLTNS